MIVSITKYSPYTCYTHFRATLVFQIYQCWTPSPGGQNHLVGVILRTVYRLNANTCRSIAFKKGLLK